MKSEANISNQKFHALNGVNDIPRSEIETIVDLAKQENNTEVIYRLSKVLRQNPDAKTFNMTIAKYPATGLKGAQHTGDYKEALDDCGRLRPGYRFMGGKVVKVAPKVKTAKPERVKKTASNFGKKITRVKKEKKIVDVAPESKPEAKPKINLADYLFDEKHPLLVLSENSPQFKSALKEFEKEVAKFGSENPGHWILKSAVKNEPESTIYPFSKNDIPYEKAYRAHTGTSFSPEKRAVQEQNGYFEDMKKVYDEYKPKAEAKGKLSEFETQFERFQSGYLKRKLEYLNSRQGFFSTMIAGGSNFPVARMQKKSRIIDNKMQEFIDWYNKGLKKIKEILIDDVDKPIKSGTQNALELLKQKLANYEKYQEQAVEANKSLRKIVAKKLPFNETLLQYKQALANIGFSEKNIKDIVSLGERDQKVFWLYLNTTNNSAEIRRIKQRIVAEEKLQERKETESNFGGPRSYTFDGGKIVENTEENRLQILFDAKPDEAMRNALKKGGYRYSPRGNAWQRNLNTFGRYHWQHLESLLPGLKKEIVVKKEETGQTSLFGAKKNHDTYGGINHKISGTNLDFEALSDLPYHNLARAKKVYNNLTSQQKKDFKRFVEGTDAANEGLYKDFIAMVAPKAKKKQPQLKGIVQSLATNLLANSLMAPAAKSNPNSLASRINQRANAKHEYYTVADKEIAKFLGNIEKKTKESVAITLAGGQGSMKTRFCFQLMNALAQNYKVGHASIEEHPESALYFDKAKQYCNDKALHNISAPEINSIEDVHKLTRENDVIVIDSFSKLQEMDKNCQLDKDFRKAYDGKLFIIIYQLTSDGKMRGGAKSQFDGDCIAFIEKKPNYTENYVWWDKNRYQSTPELKYNIYSGKIQKEPEPEASKQKDKPKTETFSFEIV